MSEKKLDCCVVRDLLPSYLEELTEEATAAQVKEHLDSCPDCRQREQDMRCAVPVEKHVKKELYFLKRLKKTRLLGAALSLVITLWCMGALYGAEFCYEDTNAGRQRAVEEYVLSSKDSALRHSVKEGTPIRAVEWKDVENYRFIFYVAEDEDNTYGILQLKRGINNKYRAIQTDYSPSQYSGGIYGGILPSRGTEWPMALCYYAGANCRYIYRAQVEFSGHYAYETITVTKDIYPRGEEFFTIRTLSELAVELGVPVEGLVTIGVEKMMLYDVEGNDVTYEYLDETVDTNWSGSKSTAELGMVYVFMAIVAVLGGIFVSYFLRKD